MIPKTHLDTAYRITMVRRKYAEGCAMTLGNDELSLDEALSLLNSTADTEWVKSGNRIATRTMVISPINAY